MNNFINARFLKATPILIKGSLTIFIAVGTFSAWQGTRNLWRNLTGMLNYQVTSPTIKDPHLLIQQIQGVSELTTTVFVMDAIAPISSQRKLGEWVIGETSLLYIARGEVKAGLDLSKITPNDVKINQDTITIKLPSPEILDSKIDVTKSQVYDYDRGFLNLGPDNAPQLQSEAQKQTLNKIKQTACDENILEQANERAIMVISQLMKTSGYKNVVVETSNLKTCL
ncbi:DUF4230 domain-containing protein [Cyanobacterium sp. Dongsha4]|uniref:DUF4230 domain-containing protein n=1 Tax=Cyanobacterium sp. DS4 TaxID=2878255 RepID=UPI002E81C34F|nr:DUF4230 domain-containing protein [Cyanobacterium sp. Dongsha4]WVL00692.1 DUF4230 domain-containing protein [Cyanobacterium sp. Dongsha4]